jgi:glycosyltransferase involved in cell wall biosynthesis
MDSGAQETPAPLSAALRSPVLRRFLPRLGLLRQYSPRPLRIRRPPDLGVPSSQLPSISLVTPSFQQGHFLRQTIASVFAQHYPRLEYFVQDGGSTDETASILQSFSAQLTGWTIAPDCGQANAINLAFRRTTGEIMGWLNSDDLLLPGALHYVGQFFARHPHVAALYGNRVLIDEQGLDIGRWILPRHDNGILPWVDYVPQETLFWRRSLWDSVGGHIDESLQFAIDWDLLLRFHKAGAQFAHARHFLGAFRVHAEQKTSSQNHTTGAREVELLRRKYLGFTPTFPQIRKRVFWYLGCHMLEHARIWLVDRSSS